MTKLNDRFYVVVRESDGYLCSRHQHNPIYHERRNAERLRDALPFPARVAWVELVEVQIPNE